MNERQIQLAIAANIRTSVVVAAPNYTPDGWWECDVWAVTRTGYAVEYEIKCSIADFKADGHKSKLIRPARGEPWCNTKKHSLIGGKNSPSRFVYVVPADLGDAIAPLLPEWAGLSIATNRWNVKAIRSAPRLHSNKVGKREIRLAQTRMWSRYWECLRDMDRMRDDLIKMGQRTQQTGDAA